MSKPLVRYCMTCGKIKLDGKWVLAGKALVGYQLSHGYCDKCAEKAIEDAKMQIEDLKRLHKNVPEWQRECAKCGEFDYPYRMKDNLCVYCQPCSACGKTECEKNVYFTDGSYFCSDCYEGTLTLAERKHRNQEALI